MTAKNGTSRLLAVKRGRLDTAHRYLIYGPESVGKTTLASHARNPIIFDIEDGSSELDVPRYPLHPDGDHVPTKLSYVYDGLADLIDNKTDYGALIVDSIDRLEPLIWNHCLERDSGKVSQLNPKGKRFESIEHYGYGKGYSVALDEWRNFCFGLDKLRRSRNMNIILVGHSQIRLFKNPEGEDFDRYQLRIDGRAGGFLKEWVDLVGFFCFEEGGGRLDPDQPKAKGWSTDRRLLKLVRTAAYDAKSRIPMPRQVEIPAGDPWAPIAKAVVDSRSLTPDKIAEQISAELQRIGDPELNQKVDEAVAACVASQDPIRLMRYLNNLKGREPKEKAANV